MSRLAPESVERVRAAADITDIVSAHTDLRQRGTRYTGLCPFHDERTPSFSVDPAANLYYCFGCQAGGDVFTFLQEKEGLEFREAVEQLAERYGVELTYEASSRQDEERRRSRERLYEVLAKAAGFYSRYLWEAGEAGRARAYLEHRGLEREVLAEFGVGFAPGAWSRVCTSALDSGYTEQELRSAGLTQESSKGGIRDRFRGRIMFPLRNARGRVLGFGARAMRDDQGPKYVNSPESAVYHKGRSLFGLDLARPHATKADRVIVVEGYTDVLALHQAGIRNSVAAMGTALTEDQIAELARLSRAVVLAFDADRSGQEAMIRAQRAAAGRQLDLKVVRLPDDTDPCELVRQEGRDGFAARVEEATSLLRFQVQTVIEAADPESPAGKDAALGELAPIFANVRPSAERDEQMRYVAGELDLPEHLLAPLAAVRPDRPDSAAEPTQPLRGSAARAERWERIFLAMCVSSGERGRGYLERLSDDHLSSEVLRRARRWLLEHPGSPTSGLGHGDEQLAQAVSEIVVRASSQPASEQALEIGFLGLERRRLERAMKLAAGSEDFERQRELSLRRNETTEAIVGLMGQPGRVGAREHVEPPRRAGRGSA